MVILKKNIIIKRSEKEQENKHNRKVTIQIDFKTNRKVSIGVPAPVFYIYFFILGRNDLWIEVMKNIILDNDIEGVNLRCKCRR